MIFKKRVYHDRRGERLPGKERKDQKYTVTSGPISDTYSGNFGKMEQMPSSSTHWSDPKEKDPWSPARNPEQGYYQQVAFKGPALDKIGTFDRRIYRPS